MMRFEPPGWPSTKSVISYTPSLYVTQMPFCFVLCFATCDGGQSNWFARLATRSAVNYGDSAGPKLSMFGFGDFDHRTEFLLTSPRVNVACSALQCAVLTPR